MNNKITIRSIIQWHESNLSGVILFWLVFFCCFGMVSGLYAASASPGNPLSVYPWNPFSKIKILPSTAESSFQQGDQIFITSTPGEFEPGSFVIRAHKASDSISIESSDLHDANGHVILSKSVDIRLVKCWYQAGEGTINNTGKRVLVPELLLYDDELIKVDYKDRKNYLRISKDGREQYIDISSENSNVPSFALFDDTSVLKPFSLEKKTNKQIWLTLHTPEGTAPGLYSGQLTISADKKTVAVMKLQVKVLPFSLPDPVLDYAIYYRGILTDRIVTKVSSELKNSRQYRAELKNMVEHGIQYPTIYQSPGNQSLKKSLEIRNEFGFRKDRLFTLGTTTGNNTDIKGLRYLDKQLDVWRKAAEEYGYGKVFVYGIDEAVGEKLKSQRLSWELVHKNGMGVFTAVYEGAVKLTGDILDLPILSGYKPEEVGRWHSKGKLVYCYGNPQVGIEDSLIYRENFGLALWLGGYDGSMQYAYQHGFGEIWNDFDHHEFRDHVFAYPTRNGVIDTVQWEGFREGVKDVRYLTLLLQMNKADKDKFKAVLSSKLISFKQKPDDARAWLTEQILLRVSPGNQAL